MELHPDTVTERYDRVPDPIFIGGHMRSGTSFVMKLLLGHRDTSGFNADAAVLQPVLDTWMPENRRLDPYSGITAVLRGDEARRRKLTRSIWFFTCEFGGLPVFKRRIVEKTPNSQLVFARAAEVFPHAAFVTVIREPVASVRSALAHSLLFAPDRARDSGALLQSLVEAWCDSMRQTQEAARLVGSRMLLINYSEFLKDINAGTRSLFEWCGLECSAEAIARSITKAGEPGAERVFWRKILQWSDGEFAARYEAKLTERQQHWIAKAGMRLYEEIDGLREAGCSLNRPGFSASAATVTTASPGS